MTRHIDADTGESLTFGPREPVCLNSLSNPSWWDRRGTEQYGDPWATVAPREITWHDVNSPRPVGERWSMRPFGPGWYLQAIRAQARAEVGRITHYCRYHDLYRCWMHGETVNY